MRSDGPGQAWTRRAALGGLGAASTLPSLAAHAPLAWTRVHRRGWSTGDIAIAGPPELADVLPWQMTHAAHGPRETDALVVDATRPDHITVHAPAESPRWHGALGRPDGESADWRETVVSALVGVFSSVPSLLAYAPAELVYSLTHPSVASAAWAPTLSAGDAMVRGLDRRAVPLASADSVLLVVPERLGLRAAAALGDVVRAEMGSEARLFWTVPAIQSAAPPVQLVSIRKQGS